MKKVNEASPRTLVNFLKDKGKPTRIPYKHAIFEEMKDLVCQFYQGDAISRVMIGKKDIVTVRTLVTHKQEQRKHLLSDDIVDIHCKYLEPDLEIPIGKSKFFELRPL